MGDSELKEVTDGVVTLRPPRSDDAELLVEGRDDEFFRWLGTGSENPSPVACVWVEGELVGRVDYDLEHDWLRPGEVNVGYYLFPLARGKGHASRAVELLLLHLRDATQHSVATLVIDPENAASLRLAHRLGFVEKGELERGLFFARELRPVL
jgi:RimJ/RimL family protein N-acetyltransferase